MILNKIEQSFAKKAIIRGGVFLLKWNDAVEFINACQNERIRILGVDAFFLSEDRTQPSMEHGADFTAKPYNNEKDVGTHDVARMMVERAKDMYFEIVIDI